MTTQDWGIQQARELYNTAHWGGGYFDVADNGHLIAQPRGAQGPCIDMPELVKAMQAAGLTLPVLVRFNGILQHRVDTLVEAFAEAMAEVDYQGSYTAVYPIKVNQQRSVVEEIVSHGDGRVGLEAGSKPELMAVLALTPRGGSIVCNGYKDREYIRLALVGRALGHRVFIVVEKRSELELIIEEAEAMGVEPLLGLRVRLASVGAGKWQNSGGERSKFGLSATEILQVVARLKQSGHSAALKMLHFHLGSQIANIRDIQRGVKELARFYVELHRLGVGIEVVDVGGGLGVDYEGTRSRSFCSMNYSVTEYAYNVVHALWEVCSQSGLPHPHIISESGRALTAHHAVLITQVIDSETIADTAQHITLNESSPLILQNLAEAMDTMASRSPVEVYHDTVHWLAEAQSMYTHGVLSLAERAQVEQFYFAICRRLHERLQPSVRAHREVLDELNEKLADKYFCNFSLFQSLPDVWGIDQIFPIMPLSRLDEEPRRRVVLEDITCDSDGRIDHYVDREGLDTSLPLHGLIAGEPYLLAFFMVGAYQEILGDMHNLFGDTDSVNVVLDEAGQYRLENVDQGDTVDDLLRYVHFEPDSLRIAYQQKIAKAGLNEAQGEQFMAILELGLQGYTYLEE